MLALAQWHQLCSGSRQDFRLAQVQSAETLDEFRYGESELWGHWAIARFHVQAIERGQMLETIQARLDEMGIFQCQDILNQRSTVIGYDKRFRWRWLATQMNTFVFASDYGEQRVTVSEIEQLLDAGFEYARQHYTGWPRGLQSGLASIAILLSSEIDEAAIAYCSELRPGKKWAGFSVPVVLDTGSHNVHIFDRNPVWGRIYYPFFKRLASDILRSPS